MFFKLKVGDIVFIPRWPAYDEPSIRSGVVTSIGEGIVTYVIRKTIVQHVDAEVCYQTQGEAAEKLVNLARKRIAKLEKVVQQFSPAPAAVPSDRNACPSA